MMTDPVFLTLMALFICGCVIFFMALTGRKVRFYEDDDQIQRG